MYSDRLPVLQINTRVETIVMLVETVYIKAELRGLCFFSLHYIISPQNPMTRHQILLMLSGSI